MISQHIPLFDTCKRGKPETPFAARSLVYSVRNGWRRTVSLAWNGALFQALRENQLLRLSIHPPDHGFPEIWRQIERFIEEVRETHTATTYGDWIAEQRLQTPI